ncbi:glutamate ABC transporter substrate-binding protein [Amycolatopsis sp. H20-H5]|uniref:glutamate ABC transporter substrate-binding protein n=1 Tax=Amycolatopsis sp. H20-H5 TaxID=3046309 RepID=UPI002DB8248E|nr:glutamate ABC transporter substrate-binding protein [Amycolatopsis sp. H20-H5]MEC3976607.1 glutamate ABC transporter substrate-binding protein [Amycolatopsis sp. H20-H5]
MSSTQLRRGGKRGWTVVAAAITLLGAAAGCGDSPNAPALPGASGGEGYDALIQSAPVAPTSLVDASPWASKIRAQGNLRVGGTDAGPLFSIKSLDNGELTGFDAGLSQMLARYITGKSAVKDLTTLTITTVDTREALLQNSSIDAVFATYTITPPRAAKVDFAGPYYESGDAIMTKKDNTSINSVADLNGKTVVTEADSTAALEIKKFAPNANLLLFQHDPECVAAVQQGRADAYVLDQGILVSDASSNPAVKVVGQPFTHEPYGIGLPKQDPSAKQFVNAWLQTMFTSGQWAKLWKATLGTVVQGATPEPPKIGSVPGS